MTDASLNPCRSEGLADSDTLPMIRMRLADWYERNHRDLPWRRTDDPYAIWVSEVMLQQTQVKTVVPYYRRFLERFPDPQCLAAADLQTVYKLWEGLGYYSRARHLHQAARIICSQMDCKIPHDPDALRRLPGIGPYICAAILSIAFGQPFAVVDGNVKRVLARLSRIPAPVNQAGTHHLFQSAADRLLERHDPSRHNQAMMELGALICTPRQPLCRQCPLTSYCQACRNGAVDLFPRRLRRPPRVEQHWVAGVVIKKGRILMTQRPDHGLLAGLWEFPCGVLGPGDDPAAGCVMAVGDSVGLLVDGPQMITTVRHAYTHFTLRMAVCLCRWQDGRVRLNGPSAFQWVRFGQITRLPLHGAVHKVLPALDKTIAAG